MWASARADHIYKASQVCVELLCCLPAWIEGILWSSHCISKGSEEAAWWPWMLLASTIATCYKASPPLVAQVGWLPHISLKRPERSCRWLSVFSLWSYSRGSPSLGLYAIWSSFAPSSWDITITRQPQWTCVLLEPVHSHLFLWAGLQRHAWEGPRLSIFAPYFILLVSWWY